MSRLYPFLSSVDVPFKTRIRAAHSLIISNLTYGQEILSLTKTQMDQIEMVLLKTLRVILNQPIESKASAIYLIYGQSLLEYMRMTSRIMNEIMNFI